MGMGGISVQQIRQDTKGTEVFVLGHKRDGGICVVDSQKYIFYSGGRAYVVWLWKGDYINMGAGAEIGFYNIDTRIMTNLFGEETTRNFVNTFDNVIFWEEADQKDTMTNNTLVLNYVGAGGSSENVFQYYPDTTQWWTTGFNSDYQNVNAKDLYATGTMDFSVNPYTEQLFADFHEEYRYRSGIDFDENTYTVTLHW
jgi:hypothetical protein